MNAAKFCRYPVFITLLFSLFTLAACKKSDPGPALPSVTTTLAADITIKSAVLGGSVTSSGGDSVLERGICYATTSMPTVASTKVTMGNGSGAFSSTISGLKPDTKYFVRAYATNAAGTAYGNEISFVTTAIDSAKTVYIGAASYLIAFSADSAKTKWVKALGGPVNSSPFYAKGMVYVGCGDGNVYAFDTTGSLKWKSFTGTYIGASSPVVSKGVVFICNRNSVCAFDAATGSLKWKFDHNYGGASGPVVANNKVYVNAGNAYALDEATGALVWNTWMAQATMLPKVSGSRYYGQYGNDYVLRALDANTGDIVKTTYLEVSQPASVNVANGRIFLCQESWITVMDSATLNPIWARRIGGGIQASSLQAGSSPIVIDSVLNVVVSSTGGIEQYNAMTGAFLNGFGHDLVDNDVTIVYNLCYFGTRDIFNYNNGRIIAYDISFEGKGWEVPLNVDFSTTACVVTKSGKMYRAGDVYQ